MGSGGGEWACAQAAASADSVDWVTLELRSDRVYHTFLNCIFSNLTNLAMLGGDVHKVAAKIRPGSLGAIFVNHPEPPHQYDDGGSGDGGSRSDGEHMLTPQFFAAAYRSLEPGGRLTIVTDNQHYARLLLQSVAALSDGGKRYVSSPLHRFARAFYSPRHQSAASDCTAFESLYSLLSLRCVHVVLVNTDTFTRTNSKENKEEQKM